jgi:restriction system protein
MWKHNSSTDRIDVRWFQCSCEFCDSELIEISIPDRWPIDPSLLKQEHESRIDSLSTYLEDTYAEHRKILSGFSVNDVQFRLCPVCGWWCIIRDIEYRVPGRPYMAFNWAAGCLLDDMPLLAAAPVNEIRKILCASYEQRFSLDPHRMEDIVASVFHSFDCKVEISKKSHDGGIDVFGIDQVGMPFGIQVKRHRNKVRIDEIRSFLGALLLHGIANGVFVTTSTFTGGASRLQQQAGVAGIRLDCMDSERLLEMIKVAQIKDFNLDDAPQIAESYARRIPSLHFGYCSHLGGL